MKVGKITKGAPPYELVGNGYGKHSAIIMKIEALKSGEYLPIHCENHDEACAVALSLRSSLYRRRMITGKLHKLVQKGNEIVIAVRAVKS